VKLIVAKDGLSKSLFELRVYSINAFYWLRRNKGGTASFRPFCDEGSFGVENPNFIFGYSKAPSERM